MLDAIAYYAGAVVLLLGGAWLSMELANLAVERVLKQWKIVPAFLHFLFASKWFKGDARMSASLDGQNIVWKQAESRGLAMHDGDEWIWIAGKKHSPAQQQEDEGR